MYTMVQSAPVHISGSNRSPIIPITVSSRAIYEVAALPDLQQSLDQESVIDVNAAAANTEVAKEAAALPPPSRPTAEAASASMVQQSIETKNEHADQKTEKAPIPDQGSATNRTERHHRTARQSWMEAFASRLFKPSRHPNYR
jgi:hypothetical protein